LRLTRDLLPWPAVRGVRNNPAVRRSRAAKCDCIDQVEELVEDAALVAVVGYRGINGPKAQQLRSAVAQLGGRYHVVKNRLARIALARGDLAPLAEYFDGPSALLVGDRDPDRLLLGFRTFLGGAFKTPLFRNFSGRRGVGPGAREGAFELALRAISLDRRVLAPEEIELVIEAGGLAAVRARLLRAMTAPARFLGVLAAPPQRFAALVATRPSSP
jgi:ribosomal protein L10